LLDFPFRLSLFAEVQYFSVARLSRAIFRPSLYWQLTNYNNKMEPY